MVNMPLDQTVASLLLLPNRSQHKQIQLIDVYIKFRPYTIENPQKKKSICILHYMIKNKHNLATRSAILSFCKFHFSQLAKEPKQWLQTAREGNKTRHYTYRTSQLDTHEISNCPY